MRATGTFEVEIERLPSSFEDSGATGPSRASIRKRFTGDLTATSHGEMISAFGSREGSAGYVAIEQVVGTLQGREGSFALQHFGLMDRGNQRLVVEVIPDSGHGQLEGLAGTLSITITEAEHRYQFDYDLAETSD